MRGRGGATVGSMGSHDPLKAMEITLEVPWSCWCDPLELHTTCSMKCLKEEKDFGCRLKKKEGRAREKKKTSVAGLEGSSTWFTAGGKDDKERKTTCYSPFFSF
ncbi:hypothetical protein DVH24_009889 [Malus domestica]|uniref:Uncharacterized protein n=1 Tax=Malus domestica TaxID=3750 RepID=A0A498JUT8_MALDO|nr:hypothetical protein DVH24_009889 [Malus domestica]